MRTRARRTGENTAFIKRSIRSSSGMVSEIRGRGLFFRRRQPCHSKPRTHDRQSSSSFRSAGACHSEYNPRKIEKSLFITSDGETFLFVKLLLRDKNFRAAHVRSERFGNLNAAVSLEIVLKESDEHSRRSDYGVVEGVSEVASCRFRLL